MNTPQTYVVTTRFLNAFGGDVQPGTILSVTPARYKRGWFRLTETRAGDEIAFVSQRVLDECCRKEEVADVS